MTTSVFASGSYGGYSGSSSLDVNKFNQQASNSSTFGSHKYQVNSGSTIVETDGVYRVDTNDQRTPVPIHMTLQSIDTALDSSMWDAATYKSLNIAGKQKNLKQALDSYPNWINAPTSADGM